MARDLLNPILQTERPKSQTPILKFEDVGFAYDGRDILKDVSFSVRRGELIALLGPSGCGKTTILNVVAGFINASHGCAFIDGKLIDRPGPDRGVVFQSYALFDWMTVRDNITFSLRCAGKSRKERREVAERMTNLVGLGGFEDRYPYQLSGGMRQRCGLARVLAANPKVMLMDEPFAAVDVQTRETLQEEILNVKEKMGSTILFVTHSIDEAVFLADRIFVITNLAQGQYLDIPVNLPSPRSSPSNRLHPDFLALREDIYLRMRTDKPAVTAVSNEGAAK
ncbi:MAG: ABC transporter ATP-binding protein [Bradyrhizobiaceae bacterium]|nr:MAG: ABC transporter ATP-binding protein [Bradyrhizobiaceae bacterium]